MTPISLDMTPIRRRKTPIRRRKTPIRRRKTPIRRRKTPIRRWKTLLRPTLDGGDEDEPELPPLCDDGLVPDLRWGEKARLIIDPDALEVALAAAGATLPAGTEVYALRIVDGVDGPAFLLWEAGDGAFSQDFWPASTIKLISSLGALDFIGTLSFTGAATVTFDTGFSDTVRDIIDRAIRVSSNEDYDRTVRIAGFDRLNDQFLVADNGFPSLVIQRSYTGTGVRLSPGMTLREGEREQRVEARESTSADRCPPRDGNCANLFELTDGLRRIVLHDELAEEERFALAAADVAALLDALCGSSSSYLRPGAEAVFGAEVEVCNKTGTVPGDDYLDHGLIVAPSTGARYLVALSVPEQGSYSLSTAATERAAEGVIRAVAGLSTDGPTLQLDSGAPIVVQLDEHGATGDGRIAYTITVEVEGADRVEVFTDRWLLGEFTGAGPRFSFDYAFSQGGERLMSIRAFDGDTMVGYRSTAVLLTPP